MTSSSSNRNQLPRPESRTSSGLTQGSVPAPGLSDSNNECTEQEQGNGEKLGAGDQRQAVSSSSTALYTDGNNGMVITSIRAIDLALGLRRIPAGFYTMVRHSGLEWRTENKRNDDVIEWGGPIPIPSDLSATICFEIYASFESQPILGDGEQLQKLIITVEQLLDRSAKDVPFSFLPKDGAVVSPSSSILVMVRQRECGSMDPSGALGPLCLTTESRGELEEMTSQAHSANQAATFVLQPRAGRRVGAVRVDDQSSMEQDAASRLTEEGPWTLSCQLLHRFEQFGDLADLQRAITFLEQWVRSASAWHDGYLAGLGNLAGALWTRFQHLGDLSDLEEAISRQREVVDLTSHGHPSKRDYLSNLGNCFFARFERLGELSDLEEAISRYRDVVDLTPHGHPGKPAYLSNLGAAITVRFVRLEELTDLDEAISKHRDAVDLTPHGHPDKPSYLSTLGIALATRFERLGEVSDIGEVISKQVEAVDLTPHGHPERPTYLSNLGMSLVTRFKCLGELSDLEDAISRLSDADNLTPHGHPHKPCQLNDLGKSFRVRFRCLGELSDLDKAISRHKEAVDLTPHGHPDKPIFLSTLGGALVTRFKHLGEVSDIEEAISRQMDTIELTPHGHPNKPAHLNSLGISFKARFQRLGELSDLEEAISTHRNALDLTPRGHPDKPTRLNNLGNSFYSRFERLGELRDLEEAISRQKDAVDLIPHGHPAKLCLLNHLSISFFARFQHFGELSALEEAISRQKDVVDLTPHDRPDKQVHLNSLANSIYARFERLGELSDLEEAILRQKDAYNLTPHGHPDKPVHLNCLGNSFQARFERLGELKDLEEAILMHKAAVDLTPNGHPGKPGRLNNLGNSYLTRFRHLQEPSDLEEAILTYKDAVNLMPHGHPDKPACLNNLGNSISARFQCLGELGDIEEAISRLKDAVDLTSDGHPSKPAYLNNLGKTTSARFQCLGELDDLEEAISRLKDAVDLTPDGHPNKPDYLNNLGNSLLARFKRIGALNNLEQAISLYSRAASASIGPIAARFGTSQNWISCARHIRHPSLLHAYSVAIGLLPQLAWIGLSLAHRYHELMQGANVVREAAAAALDLGLPETAVEWLEQGRSIVWGELFQLRSSYEELSSVHPNHARRLRELSVALEHAGATREKSQSAEHRATGSLQQEVDRHRALAIERDKLLQEIRRLPGFERFLFHKEFSQLCASGHSGPVVILNAAESRCDALIILARVDHVIHVPLPNFTFERSAGLQKMLKSLLGDARAISFDDLERVGKPATRGGVSWESLLSTLWTGVVKPVLDALAISTPGELSRIFWCPTGPFVFLPIHAAGLYGTEYSQPGHKVSDFVISSYVPTLSILAPSSNPDVAPSGNISLLAVRQPPSDGLSPLPGVDIELERVREVIRNSPSARTTLLESPVGTVEEVLTLMKEADWVHFACHGIQDDVTPTNSGLCLADRRRLKISDIMALSRPRGGLAFLSACQTATGDEGLSDEAIHIAAGMLFAGYGGVVGTMWSISDRLAPRVTSEVYGQLFRDGTTPDYREAARALHEAIGRLRDSKVRFVEWLPFIHVGL